MKYRRKTHETMRYAPPLPYNPQSTKRITPSSSQPWTEPKRSRPTPPIYQPNNLERMLKELEQRFDHKLHDQVLERMAQEFQTLFEAMTNDAEQSPDIETFPVKSQSPQIESTTQDTSVPKPEETEHNEQMEALSANETETMTDKLFDIDEAQEWLNEDTESEPSEGAELKIDIPTIEPISLESNPIEPEIPTPTMIEPQAQSQEIIEPQDNIEPIETNQNDIPQIENSLDFESIESPIGYESPLESFESPLESNLFEGVDDILDLIDPLQAIEPIEPWIEAMPETLPETEEAMEAEAY